MAELRYNETAARPPNVNIWDHCFTRLESELTEQQFNTWIRPLHARQADDSLVLLAPNRFVCDWIADNFLDRISEIARGLGGDTLKVAVRLGSADQPGPAPAVTAAAPAEIAKAAPPNVQSEYRLDNFVEGPSNRFARAAVLQVCERPGSVFNPLFLYGATGLGKTHLMHGLGNTLYERHRSKRIVYVRAEQFVEEMVNAFAHNTIDGFKRKYRQVDALLIDDIQFLAGKERSQEVFFETFNELLERKQQIVITSDRYPKEITNLDTRLKSRFGWGLTAAIDPPELETRVAILKNKAEQMGISLPDEVAFFIGQRLRSNVRELEGALRRIMAESLFTGLPVTVDFTKKALSDLLAVQEKLVTIENIQKVCSEYFKIPLKVFLSARRSRSVARPRQIAMTLAKELTNHSLPEIGEAFGGRDHTTVLHAHRKIKELRESDPRVTEDYQNLLRMLTN
ncbi:MAG: chromosomal replication initiator protein DnaA [Chromatiales bacterium]|nr:chromosomal replication initiator protein DnaA [Chromatiales bacterium]